MRVGLIAQDTFTPTFSLALSVGTAVLYSVWQCVISSWQGAARNPNDAGEQQRLKQAAEDLRSATNVAASDALKKKLVKRLEVC